MAAQCGLPTRCYCEGERDPFRVQESNNSGPAAEREAIFNYLPDYFLNSEISVAPQDSTLAIFGRPFHHRKHVVDLERSNRSISQSASNLSAVMRMRAPPTRR